MQIDLVTAFTLNTIIIFQAFPNIGDAYRVLTNLFRFTGSQK